MPRTGFVAAWSASLALSTATAVAQAQGCRVFQEVDADTAVQARVAADLRSLFPQWTVLNAPGLYGRSLRALELRSDSLRARVHVSYLLNRAEAAAALQCMLSTIAMPRFRSVDGLGAEGYVMTDSHLRFRVGRFLVGVDGPAGRADLERMIADVVAATLEREQARILDDPPRPLCRLAIRSHAGTPDSFTVEYVFMDIPFAFASWQVRQAEEVFGHSLEVRPEGSEPLRFARTPYFHYLAFLPPDTVRAGRLIYRFSFSEDRARLVPARAWEEAQNDGPGSLASERLFRQGRTTWPDGSFTISAEVELWEVTGGSELRQRSIRTHRVRCQPVNLLKG